MAGKHLFKKGDPKPPTAGRKKGTPNKDTQAVRRAGMAIADFLRATIEDDEVQEAIRQSLVERDKGAIQGFLGMVAHVKGLPKASLQLDTTPNMARLLIMAAEERERQRESKAR